MRSARRRHLTLATMCIATFMAILDTTVVNLALHAIRRDLRASVSTLQWILDVYNLTYAAFILTGGVLGDLFGRRRVFASGIVLFTLGSVVCALAPNPAVLIVGRGVAGLGAALQLPGSLSVLTVTFPEPRERSNVLAVWGGFNGLAMAVGPTLGGLLVDHLGWRSIFYLVVPFGGAVLILTGLAVSESSNPEGRRVDLPGQALAVAILAFLTFGCIEAPVRGWFSPIILGSLALAAASTAAFTFVERAKSGALLPMDLLRQRTFSASIAIAALMTFGFYTLMFIFPLYLQSIRGHSAVRAGIEFLPMSLTFFFFSPLAARLVRAMGASALIALGVALMGGGILVLAAVGRESRYPMMSIGLLGLGVGMALAFGPIMTVAVSSIPSARSGTSSGMVNVGRMVGATLGVAIPGSIFGAEVTQAAADAVRFSRGMHVALLTGGFAELVGALLAILFLGRESLSTRFATLRAQLLRHGA